ncbi:MAG: hypothetical protein Q8P11_00135 [bacterium]|nr:hypothetical protein [bacterium]
MKVSKNTTKKEEATHVYAKTALIPFFIVTLGLLGFLGYAASHAATADFLEPECKPPGCQPAGGGTGGLIPNLYEVLKKDSDTISDASLYLGKTILGGELHVPSLCFPDGCKSSWADLVGSTLNHMRVTAPQGTANVVTSWTSIPGGVITNLDNSGHRMLLDYTGEVWVPSDCSVWLRFTVDGTPYGGWPYGIQGTHSSTISYLTESLPSGPHTYTVQVRQEDVQGSTCASAGAVNFNSAGTFQVMEMPDTSSVVTGGGGGGSTTTPTLQEVTTEGSTTDKAITTGTITINGNATVKGDKFTQLGDTGRINLGDANHYIQSTFGNGVSIGTWGATDGIVLKEGSGNVGIGTTSPGAKLDVSGNVKVGGTIRITGGFPSAGKVLTSSDVSGNATWETPILSTGASGEGVMYLRQYGGNVSKPDPANCPSGWTQADFGREYAGSSSNAVRTCYTENSCRIMYLRQYHGNTYKPSPANCPSGWTEADLGEEYAGSSSNSVRTCYQCSP